MPSAFAKSAQVPARCRKSKLDAAQRDPDAIFEVSSDGSFSDSDSGDDYL